MLHPQRRARGEGGGDNLHGECSVTNSLKLAILPWKEGGGSCTPKGFYMVDRRLNPFGLFNGVLDHYYHETHLLLILKKLRQHARTHTHERYARTALTFFCFCFSVLLAYSPGQLPTLPRHSRNEQEGVLCRPLVFSHHTHYRRLLLLFWLISSSRI